MADPAVVQRTLLVDAPFLAPDLPFPTLVVRAERTADFVAAPWAVGDKHRHVVVEVVKNDRIISASAKLMACSRLERGTSAILEEPAGTSPLTRAGGGVGGLVNGAQGFQSSRSRVGPGLGRELAAHLAQGGQGCGRAAFHAQGPSAGRRRPFGAEVVPGGHDGRPRSNRIPRSRRLTYWPVRAARPSGAPPAAFLLRVSAQAYNHPELYGRLAAALAGRVGFGPTA